MTGIEELLRDELLAQSRQLEADQLRELRVPRPRPALRGAGRAWPWLAPAGAALAVLTVIATVRLALPPGGAVSPAAAPAGMPRFYVSMTEGGSLTQPDVAVYQSATGARVTAVTVPGQVIDNVAAAGDDRTFVLATGAADRSLGVTPPAEAYYVLRLSASGRPGPLRRLPVTFTGALGAGAIALSPDGSTLAVSLTARSVGAGGTFIGPGRIKLVSLRTGAVRTFTEPARSAVTLASWARGSQTLAFLYRSPAPSAHHDQVRVLDARAPGGSLLGNSTAAPVRLPGPVSAAVVTAGGSRLIVSTRLASAGPGLQGDAVLQEFSMRTGRRLRTLLRLPTGNGVVQSVAISSADPTGRHLLIDGTTTAVVVPSIIELGPGPTSRRLIRVRMSPSTGPRLEVQDFFGRIDNGQLTRLVQGNDGLQQYGVW